jgi:hypothetical protein
MISAPRLHSQASWLYGVLVTLGVREGLSQIIPKLTNHGSEDNWTLFLHVFRLTFFLITIIRFFLGSVRYFEQVYLLDYSDEDYPRKQYGIDFLVGFVHFMIFFAWATTIADVSHRDRGYCHFTFLALAVLLYDVAWLVVNINSDTRRKILKWTLINLASVGIAALAWLFVENKYVQEEVAMCWLAAVGLVDVASLLDDEELIERAIAKIFGFTRRPDPPSPRPPAGTASGR